MYSQQDLVDKWLIKAENNFKTAVQSFKYEEIVTDTLCFHCQQAVEKYLKAYLVSKDISPAKTHRIELLLEKCMEFDSSFEELQNAVDLNIYAIEQLYPDDFYIPSIEEAEEAIELATTVKQFILKRL